MAITLERPAYYDAERVNDWVALSTDVLPTSTTPGFKLYQGDRVYLMDTGKRKVYDATADTWYEQPAIGGLGILNKNGEVINATLATVQSVATQYMVTNYGRQPKTGDALIITLTDQSNDKVLYIYSETSQVWVNTGINVDLTQYYTKSQVNGIVANEYSPSATYEVGDYCINGGVFYKCTTAIPVAEAWDATHWTATKAGSELTSLSQGKVSKPTAQTPANYVPKSDGAGGYAWGENPAGGMLPKVTITAASGSTVVMTKGAKTLTATEVSGTWVFNPDEYGAWNVTVSKFGVSTTKTIEITSVKEYALTINLGPVLGIRRSTLVSSPEWERTDDAVGLNFSATVGDVVGHSDFDDYFPWSEISRKSIYGDVMVEIPNFYIKRYTEDYYDYIKISQFPETGYVPAVQYGQTVPEKFYVGAYKCGAGFTSVTGVAPLANITRAAFRNGAQLKGTGWGIIDARTMCAVNYLILVETATYNSQAIIGRGYVDGNSSALANGSCDGIVTGRPAGVDGKIGVTYRGIENWWGNVWEWTDGINWNSGAYYIGNDRAAYSDDTTSGYSQLSYTGSTSWSKAYIKKYGLDTTDPAMMFPIEGGGSDSTYVCDAMWCGSGWRAVLRGGDWNIASAAGSFAFAADGSSSYASADSGSRLLYISP